MDISPIVVSDDEDGPPSLRIKRDFSGQDTGGGGARRGPEPRKNAKSALLLVDKTAPGGVKKQRVARKKRTSSKKEKFESLPFWINSPKDLRDIPSHIKMVCDRLVHVEKQIKKFCLERQGLLSALWKLKGDGYGNLFPDPVLKSLTLYDVEDREGEAEREERATPDSEVEEQLNYNNLEEPKLGEAEEKLWKSTWLSRDPEASPTRTPTIKRFMANSARRSDSSYYYSKVSSVRESKPSSYSVQSDETRDSDEPVEEPIAFFRNLDFSTLSQSDINAWRRFFGLKVLRARLIDRVQKMAEPDLVRELERIRNYLVSFVDT